MNVYTRFVSIVMLLSNSGKAIPMSRVAIVAVIFFSKYLYFDWLSVWNGLIFWRKSGPMDETIFGFQIK